MLRDSKGNVMAVYKVELVGATLETYLEEQMLYGSSRIGLLKRHLYLDVTSTFPETTASDPESEIEFFYYNPLEPTTEDPVADPFLELGHHVHMPKIYGDKRYELSNHLGNVLSVITDRKVPVEGTTDHVDYHEPWVLSVSDYYAFGSLMPGRNDQTPEYRYGFNGMEKDDEAKGEGNSYDFSFRIYDSRLGKFLSVDPLNKDFPWNSSYAFAENRVVDGKDLEGKEWTCQTNYNATTGITNTHFTLAIQIVIDGDIVTEKNKELYADALKLRFELTYSQFDKETMTDYTAELCYSFVPKDASEDEAPYRVDAWVNEKDKILGGEANPARGLTEKNNNTQYNKITLLVGSKKEGRITRGSIVDVARTFVKETGHALGFYHADGPDQSAVTSDGRRASYTNSLTPGVHKAHKNGTLNPLNLMYHNALDKGTQLTSEQFKVATEQVLKQQTTPPDKKYERKAEYIWTK